MPSGDTHAYAETTGGVTVSVKREGTRQRWSVSITVEEPAVAPSRGDRAVAVDVRWRSIDDALLCAHLLDTDGTEWSVDLPDGVRSGLSKADAVRAAGDAHFDTYREQLADWIGDAANLPGWLAARARGLRLWKSRPKLRALRHAWARQRFSGDDEGWAILDAWWKGPNWTPEHKRQGGEYHLADWEAAQRRKALGRRDATYADLAARLARRYDVIVVEDFDKRAFAAAETNEPPEDHHKRVAQRASAPSRLILFLKRAAQTHGAHVVKVPCAGTTIDCHACGHRDVDWSPAVDIDHRCSSCGATWYQWANAVRNLLARWRERSGGDEDGDVVVLQHGREMEVLAEMNMGSAVYGTVVPANGALILNNRNQLFSLAID